MAEGAGNGLLDLEKELTCSICTEVLYQPLTLLDCLHTFCGSCLKEWFSWQATQGSASRQNPFTCPSCRASVRDTRPDAKITTLLEMYLQANPSRTRSAQEKDEMKVKYTPGENVLPKVKRRKESRGEAEDRRMVEEVREMSLRDVGIRGTGSYERGVRHRIRDGAVGDPSDGARQSRGNDRSDGERPSTASDAASQARRIEHQSSLRSLLSSSSIDSSEMQEEILRQITDEGLLDGIDLNNMDVSQEDELSEKIAQAYRRRHGRRSRPREHHAESIHNTAQNQAPAPDRQYRRPPRSPNPTEQTPPSSHHPPLSRPHLLEAYPTGQGHRRRTSSETRRQTSPMPSSSGRRGSSETQRQAARSATDLSQRPPASTNQRPYIADVSHGVRRQADSNTIVPRGVSQDRSLQVHRSPIAQARDTTMAAASRSSIDPSVPSPVSSGQDMYTLAVPAREADHERDDSPEENLRSVSTNSVQPVIDTRETLASYAEPSISCEHCGKQNVQYELHWNCSKCHDGKYNICQRCFRNGRGCLHWYGFGYAAINRFRNQQAPARDARDTELPHRLQGHCYLRPPPESLQPQNPGSSLRTSSDPKQRLQSGPFCSNCSSFTPGCYWQCEICNEGEWGFCNLCVNQTRCCTHALLPVTYFNSKTTSRFPASTTSQNSPPHQIELPATSSADMRRQDQGHEEPYVPLTFSTKCDICTYPIPPSTTRFHCPQCRAGDYDIDAICYQKLVHNGKITSANGPKGWRRCPNGHRMIVVGFEDSNLGQRRIVVEDLVGGHALKDDTNTDGSHEWSWREGQQRQGKMVSKVSTIRMSAASESMANDDNTHPLLRRYPPNGGVGMRILALWSWWPQDGAEDELAFPKGAEIRECEDINGDWFWGIYCAKKGLFPSNYGRVIETLTM